RLSLLSSSFFLFFFSLSRRPPISTLFPYTTLFRSHRRGNLDRGDADAGAAALHQQRFARRQARAVVDVRPDGEEGFGQRGGLERSEEHTSELQSRGHLVCRLLLEKKKKTK